MGLGSFGNPAWRRFGRAAAVESLLERIRGKGDLVIQSHCKAEGVRVRRFVLLARRVVTGSAVIGQYPQVSCRTGRRFSFAR